MPLIRFFCVLLALTTYAQTPAYDVVIRGGRVVDGSGNPWILADVAIQDGRFARVGKVDGRGRVEIDAKGKYVSPGWIDVMDQSGGALMTSGLAENKLRMGVTTAIAGEGGTPVPAEKVADYFADLERKGISINFGTYFSETQARVAVLQYESRAPNAEELERMKTILETAMKAGVMGMTTALIYPPSSYATTAELVEMAKVAAKYGGLYASHIRGEGKEVVQSIDEAITIGEQAGLPVEIFHLKAAYKPGWGKLMKESGSHIEAARQRGVDVAADLYVYTAGGTGLEATIPSWAHEGGRQKLLERLADPKIRAQLKKEIKTGSPGWWNIIEAAGGWNGVVLANARNPENQKYIGKSLTVIAKEMHKDPAEAAFDLVAQGQGRVTAIYHMMSEQDVETALRFPWTSIGSDSGAALQSGGNDAIGLPHPRAYGNFPRVIARYVRDRKVLTLEDAVRKMTSWPATRYRLDHRGAIKEGLWADVVVFDYEKLQDRSTYPEPTLAPVGIDYVLVNGQVVIDHDKHTGLKPGKVLYGPGKEFRELKLADWLHTGGRLDLEHQGTEHKTHPWYLVLWLTGVDYFSTLGYQPGIALLAAGALSPVATTILIAVTLLCALPIYAQVAGRSYAGQGSIALLENLLHGWKGKLLVLVLIGFAATDFVITMTLSAADAAEHAIHNPYLHPYLGDHLVLLTLILLALLAAVFLKGFSEAIGLASAVAVPYLILNVIVLARAVAEIVAHPDLLSRWHLALDAKGDWTALFIAGALIFPRLALGLSGFETGVSVMPLVNGGQADQSAAIPHGRVGNTRKLLAAAAVIMSVLLMVSSFVTALLIPEEAYRIGGPANGRAIAWLAHGLLGSVFGTIYDISTILILWFAGASAMAGLLHLIPRYLPRFGMAPRWVSYPRPLILVLFTINIVVTLAFRADVNAQAGAYATGVLVLMLSAAIAAAIALWRELRRLLSLYCWVVVLVFAYTLIENVRERPDGLIIATIFILITVLVGGISRSFRSTELRVAHTQFTDEESERLWHSIAGRKVNLATVRGLDPDARRHKAGEIRQNYKIDGPIAFLNVNLLDNRSEFVADLQIRVRSEGPDYNIKVTHALAIANTVAYLSEELDPIRIFLGLSRKSLVGQALRFLLFGEGETGIMVYTILLRYWEWTPEEDVRPLIFLMSD